MPFYIHQQQLWPKFYWDNDEILSLIGKVRHAQGKLLGRMEHLGFQFQHEAMLETMSTEVVKSHEIEGEFLDAEQVRSSIAKRMGIEVVGLVPSDRHIEGVIEMMLDATQNYRVKLTKERLCNWHAALFPTGRSGMVPITVADWRKDDTGPMQVVSGAMGMERVHFEAPASARLEQEMHDFMSWLNHPAEVDSLLKAAIAHIWFITIHPFDDGNGRIARAITDMMLAKSDASAQRFYSMSGQIRLDRKMYYKVLESTQKGDLDITEWVVWFLNCLQKSILANTELLSEILKKARFWDYHRQTRFNERQHKLLNKLMDDFKGKLTTSKWAKIAKCSSDTALRDIQDLIKKNVLTKEDSGGRSTNYQLIFP